MKCGLNVRETTLESGCTLLKLKLPDENLLHWASKMEIKLWLNLNESYINDASLQFQDVSEKKKNKLEKLADQISHANIIEGYEKK